MINERASDNDKIVHLEAEVALLRQRLFGRKIEQTGDAATPQLPLFDEAESLAESLDEAGDKEIVAPTKRRGKRKPLPADLPRIEVVHELPENEPALVAAVNMPSEKKSANSLKSSRCRFASSNMFAW